MKKKKTKRQLFLELAKPNNQGYSREVSVSEFKGKYASLQLGNGGSWCRDDGALGKDYDIHRKKTGNKITSILLTPKKSHYFSQNIRPAIKKKITQKPCVVLGIKSRFIECDHKDGSKAFDTLPANQTMSLFQPMHKAVNSAKREHCKKCRRFKIRFNAKTLGYKKSQWKGGKRYEGTCEGCYWHDPIKFNNESST